MFKKILFATTASPSCDHAARVAFDMAKRYDSELTVFHVLGIPSRGYSQYVKDVRTGETVRFDGTNSFSTGAKIKSFKWVFHDGTEKRGAHAEKIYEKPGVYIAALWI